jgi:hypothetical protein
MGIRCGVGPHGTYNASPKELVDRSSVIILAACANNNGKVKITITDILKRTAQAEFSLSIGDEYKNALLSSFLVKYKEFGSGLIVFIISDPNNVAAFSFWDGTLPELEDASLTNIRELIRDKETKKEPPDTSVVRQK